MKRNFQRCIRVLVTILAVTMLFLVGIPAITYAEAAPSSSVVTETLESASRGLEDIEIGFYDPSANAFRLREDRLAGAFEDGTPIDTIHLARMEDQMYMVREGKNKEGNCINSSIPVQFTPNGSLVVALKKDGGGGGGGGGDNRCIGDPCSHCKPYNSTKGCECKVSGHCNHEVRGVGNVFSRGIFIP